ncbi:MAG: phosphopyruvate hydratase [Thermoplasmata archaeon]|nr:phosphopyruvate hydratase [Thermoplasmata archaeon]
MSIIDSLSIRKLLDSRGNPTVEVDVITISGAFGSAIAPAGASKGSHEVKDYPPKGVDEAIRVFKEKVMPELIGLDVLDQRGIDSILHEVDGSENFSNIGGNVAVATSIAVAKAAADYLGIPLYRYIGGINSFKIPYPLGNVIGGGKHAINGTTIQEFLVLTQADSVKNSIFTNAEIHKAIGKKLKEKLPGVSIGMGDEKAWVASIKDEEAFQILVDVIDEFKNSTGYRIYPAVDFAASSFYINGKYRYKDRELSPDEQIEYVSSLVEKYGLFIVEDPLEENDYEGFARLTEIIGSKCLVVGDDIFVTNIERFKKGVEMNAANAILLKPNQIGTLTDFIKTVNFAKESGYATVFSHRSGETEDSALADIAVGLNGDYIKTGTVGGERTTKLNQLIRIEEEMEE